MEDALKAVLEELKNLKKEISKLKTQPARKIVYTNAELAAMMNVTTQTLRKWRNDGLLGYSQVGGTFTYSEEDVSDFLKNTHHIAYQFEEKKVATL